MVLIYGKKGKLAYITINRPEARNALNPEVVRELSNALIDFRDDDNLGVAIVTGAGEKAFAGGADIKELVSRAQGNPFFMQINCFLPVCFLASLIAASLASVPEFEKKHLDRPDSSVSFFARSICGIV